MRDHFVLRTGESTLELPIAQPLPILSAWASLCKAASALNVPTVVRSAAAKLLQHFFHQLPRQHVWAANPMHALQLVQQHVEAASAPLLRSFVAVLFCDAERQLIANRASLKQTPSDKATLVEAEVHQLVIAKQLILALQVRPSLMDASDCCRQCAGASPGQGMDMLVDALLAPLPPLPSGLCLQDPTRECAGGSNNL